MKTAKLKDKFKQDIESAEYTYNGHFLERGVIYTVLSEHSAVIIYPLILQHPDFKNILLVNPEAVDIF